MKASYKKKRKQCMTLMTIGFQEGGGGGDAWYVVGQSQYYIGFAQQA